MNESFSSFQTGWVVAYGQMWQSMAQQDHPVLCIEDCHGTKASESLDEILAREGLEACEPASKNANNVNFKCQFNMPQLFSRMNSIGQTQIIHSHSKPFSNLCTQAGLWPMPRCGETHTPTVLSSTALGICRAGLTVHMSTWTCSKASCTPVSEANNLS